MRDLEEELNHLQKKVVELETQHFRSKEQLQMDPASYSPESFTDRNGKDRNDFTTLSKLSEEEKAEIMQLSFQLQAEGKISLKQYYESYDKYSLSRLKGYRIKFESIRKNKLYQKLKEEFATNSEDDLSHF